MQPSLVASLCIVAPFLTACAPPPPVDARCSWTTSTGTPPGRTAWPSSSRGSRPKARCPRATDPETGELTGIFKETAGRLFNDAPGLAEATDPVAGLAAAVALANSFGIISVHDVSGNFDAFMPPAASVTT